MTTLNQISAIKRHYLAQALVSDWATLAAHCNVPITNVKFKASHQNDTHWALSLVNILACKCYPVSKLREHLQAMEDQTPHLKDQLVCHVNL